MTGSDRLESALDALGRRDLDLDGVHVAVGGREVERHWSLELRRDIFSASKTVTSLAVGLAESEGRLALGDAVVDHLAGVADEPAPGVEQITLHHLLTMTSGIVYRWDDPDADHPEDPARDVLSTALGAAPGGAFAYRGASTYLLSRVIRSCTGSDLRDYLVPRLFTPLGINNPQWHRCPRGHSLGAVGLQLRTGELARLGQVLLDGGRWHDQQLVPSPYIETMT
ncbi:serine hydrolase, partial [Jatrophihabitans endophyticus]|uniref:serine hydrolase domain-containing protein n=1 Tax=Jatrophihabitans endophyticus TaxID=1206085 RepID=UPI0019E5B606